jgi:hypothetical protein
MSAWWRLCSPEVARSDEGKTSPQGDITPGPRAGLPEPAPAVGLPSRIGSDQLRCNQLQAPSSTCVPSWLRERPETEAPLEGPPELKVVEEKRAIVEGRSRRACTS